MKHYEGYKTTNSKWIVELPTEWELRRLKHLLQCNQGGVWGEDPTGTERNSVVLRSTEQTLEGKWNIVEPALRDLSGVSNLDSFLLKEGDLLVAKSSGSDAHIGKTTIFQECLVDGDAYSSNFLQRIVVSADAVPRFYWYVLNSDLSRHQYQYLQNSTSGLGNLNADLIANLHVPYPDKTTQTKIADYLDGKTAEIDALIEETEKSIELLEEYRKSVISEAVIKGLNHDVPMKDSGIEWIGEIPAHWEVKRFKYLAQVKANLVNPENYPALLQVSPERIEKDTGRLLECQTVEDAGVESDNHLFSSGQILYSKVRPALNKVTIAPFDGLCSADMYPIETDACTEWLMYVMLSQPFVTQVRVSTDRVKMPKVNKEELGAFLLPVPPLEEQHDLATHLKVVLNAIDAAIEEESRLTTALGEYRKSLISEAVTGKFKVPGEM